MAKFKVLKAKWKMGVYKDGEMVDFGIYDTKAEAMRDYINFDKPRGRTVVIERE